MKFLRENKRFSFKLGEKNIWETKYSTKINEDNNALTVTYLFEGGIKVTNVAKKYGDFDGYEWVNYIENVSEEPSEIISELWDCDCAFPLEYEAERKWTAYFPDTEAATKIYAPTGSTWTKDEFYTDINKIKENARINHIYPQNTKTYSTSGGRSSNKNAPFFNVHKNGAGYIFAIGWTGQWNCEIKRTEEDVIFKSKIEDTHFKLLPGESVRTSSVVIMAYKGDLISSQNKWRRFVKKHFSLIGTNGRDEYGPLCASVWGGMKSEYVLDRVRKIKENNLPFEYIWMDAGWYGTADPTPDEFEGDWWFHTGNWAVSPAIHPNGLKDVSDEIHASGMKFLLWFEPERVIKTTPIAKEHPEYFFSDGNEKSESFLLNLGNEHAFKYCYDMLCGLIDGLKIDCYRQDFNFEPLAYWRNNDEPDRQGISEIKHINGMYKLWDLLLEKFPNLIIDNCASGGRRIDIETLRRSMPMWRSDYQCPANYDIEASQCHHTNFGMWIPYSGTGTGRGYDEYRIRSAYDSSLSCGYSFSAREDYCDTEEKIEFLNKYLREYLKIRPYFSEDCYPLTDFSTGVDTWCAVQFDRPSHKDGIVQVFRRGESPYETAVFSLHGIDENKNYLFTDIDGGEFKISGKELKEKGLRITISEKRSAKIYLYSLQN